MRSGPVHYHHRLDGAVPRDEVVIATDASVGANLRVVAESFVATTGHYGFVAHWQHWHGTSNRNMAVLIGELRAVAIALKRVTATGPIRVQCDSQTAVQYLQRWQQGDPTLPKGYLPVRSGKGKTTLKLLADKLNGNPALASFEWVRGHSGHPLNETADQLAKLGLRVHRGELLLGAARHEARRYAQAVLVPQSHTRLA